jgi:hypothetical protein
MRIGIVISNHAAEEWTEKALREQYKLDNVLYYQHPDIDPRAGKEGVWVQALRFLNDNKITGDPNIVVASVNGEYGFSTACVSYLRYHPGSNPQIKVVYPTSERGATEERQADGSIKTVHVYKFVQFREW